VPALLRRRRIQPALVLHALNAHAFAPAAREEVDAVREADPEDARADEYGEIPIMVSTATSSRVSDDVRDARLPR
jgi:hypothetical protein